MRLLLKASLPIESENAAVNNIAAGTGLGLALSCDIQGGFDKPVFWLDIEGGPKSTKTLTIGDSPFRCL